MTSLVSTPKHKTSDSRLFISEIDENLFTVWRSSQTASLARKRLRNRSWRLISERILNGPHKAFDRSFLSLEEETSSQKTASVRDAMSQNRPSLFSDSSRYTSDSILSLQQAKQISSEQVSGEDSSDISEDEMPANDYFDYDPERGETASSALPPVLDVRNEIDGDIQKEGTAKLNMSPNHSLTGETVSRKHASHINSPTRTGSKGNIFFISGSPSPNAQDNHDRKASLSNDLAPEIRVLPGRKDSLFKSNASLSASSASNAPSSLSSTDISEVSSLDDHPNSLHETDINQVIADARSARSGRSLKSADDTESEWMSVSSESELAPESPVAQPISFPKRIPIPHSTSDESHTSPPADETLKSSPSSLKPRSLLSGLFLNEMNSAARSPGSTKSANLEHSAPKPVLKRSSTTGVITVDPSNNARGLQRPSILLSKRYASSSDFSRKVLPHRSPILYIAEENSIKEDLSKAGEQNLFAKQTSSVGLSNFLATSDAKNNTQQAEFGSPKAHIAHDASSNGADALSSSLSKYSNLQRANSFKNLFSKSSINLTSLLGPGITGKLRLQSDNRSTETLKSMPAQHPQATPAMASSFAEHLSQQSLMEPTKSESTITTGKSVRVEPTAFKSFEPSVEISASLKDSLMIDHRLGKAPLPERVISDEDLFSGHDKESFLNDSNDYHSKGW
ncbi:hypothetical protein OXX59_008090 [Metschnikowia pulcherrima]